MDKVITVIFLTTLDDLMTVLLMLQGSHMILTTKILLRCQIIVSLKK